MNRMRNPILILASTAGVSGMAWLAPMVIPTASAKPAAPLAPPLTPAQFATYNRAIQKTAGMTSDQSAQALAAKHGLQILNLTWEDTGRYKNSSVGPNISDMTIQVGALDPRSKAFNVTCMPVMRYPNFSDKTADISPRDFTLLIGNQSGRDLRRVSLHDFLNSPTAFLTRPWEWKAKKKTLLAPRDSKVLVSAQACFLPVPQGAKAIFNPVLFNYQSVAGDPAVLTVLATREGTSVMVIDNKRDAFGAGAAWGQRLFHNSNGQRASLTGQRESEFRSENSTTGPTPSVGNEAMDRGEAGLNMVLLIQVPLKQKNPMRFKSNTMAGAAPATPMMKDERSDVENAVIGHGDLEGRFTEIDNLSIERDPRFPVRVTVQFYKATSNGVASADDIRSIKEQIDRVYAQSEYVGSLVTDGETGRVTEFEGVRVQPPDWWEKFWRRYEGNTGIKRDVAIRRLRSFWRVSGAGKEYQRRPASDLYLRTLLKPKAHRQGSSRR